jgi:glycosyltransferase involved in cell wall biosynthesis
MKLLYIHNTSPIAVTANLTQVTSMCTAFFNYGLEVTLVLLESELPEADLSDFLSKRYSLPKGVNLRYLYNYTKNSKINKWASAYRIPNIIKEENPDICFVRNPQFLKHCLRAGVKSIFEVHNSRLHQGFDLLNNYLTRQLIISAKKENCIAFISISENLEKYWINKGIPKEKSISLHDGFLEESFKKITPMMEAKKRLKLPLDKPIITYTGTLHANRKTKEIVDLAYDIKSAIFVIVGGSKSEIIDHKEYADKKSIDNIIFIGTVPHVEVADYLFASNYLLAKWSPEVPTINYCSPLKVFEYMATGKPILTQNFPTIMEVLTDKKDAILAQNDDYDDLRKSIEWAIKNPDICEIMGKKSRELAFKEYSWKVRVNKIIDFIEA